MKIVSWNCKMAYRNKAESILKLNPDIAIIPECENIGEQTPKRLWFGDNFKKGLGIYSYSAFNLELIGQYNPKLRHIIPIRATGPAEFNLFAVWAMNDTQGRRKRYIGQIWLALNEYKEMLDKPTIIVGDFNSNIIWDLKGHYGLYGNFTEVVRKLEEHNIFSAYHQFYKEEFGKETRPTLFMYHDKNKSYHVDYCFTSSDFVLKSVEVGAYADWIAYSDHVPLIITLDNSKKLDGLI